MKVLMFKDQWIEPILQGKKVQTVRPPRKIPIVVGEAISLRVWTERPYASKQRTLLETHCTSVVDVVIDQGGVVVVKDGVSRDGRLTVEGCERFAKRDGFDNFRQMQDFFLQMHGLPFVGVAISWD